MREEWLNIVGLKLEMHAKIELNADEMLEKVLDWRLGVVTLSEDLVDLEACEGLVIDLMVVTEETG